jgi:multidrug efflux pump subunit AcrA (membrane-fusion protein)
MSHQRELDELTPGEPAGPRRSLIRDLVRGLLPVGIVAGAIAFYMTFGRPPAAEKKTASDEGAVAVSTSVATAFDETIVVEVDGVAQPYRHATLAAEVGGRITYKNPQCNDGRFVAAGTVLVEIDPADYQTAVDRIQEEVRQAQNALDQWEVDRTNLLEQIRLGDEDVALAVHEAERLERLFKNGVTAETEMEAALRAKLTAQQSLQGLQNQLRALEARKETALSALDLKKIELGQAELDLTRTKITAPMDALVVTDEVEQDDYVQPGTPVAILNDVSVAEVACQLELDDLFWLWESRTPPGTESASVANPAPDATSASTESATSPQSATSAEPPTDSAYEFPPIPAVVEFELHNWLCRWDGKLVRFGGTGIDLSSRTIPCRVVVDRPNESQITRRDGQPVEGRVPPPLTTGMFVSVRMEVKPHLPLVKIPATAARSGGVAWVVRDDGSLAIVPLKIARTMTDEVLIYRDAGSVQPGDRVVVSPLAVAREGMLLKEINQP